MPRPNSIYFLFITSTYRDLAGFLTVPFAPDPGRLINASRGSTIGDGVSKVDVGRDGGVAVACSSDSGGAETEGTGASVCILSILGIFVAARGMRPGPRGAAVVVVAAEMVVVGAVEADRLLGGGGGAPAFAGLGFDCNVSTELSGERYWINPFLENWVVDKGHFLSQLCFNGFAWNRWCWCWRRFCLTSLEPATKPTAWFVCAL
jgi:hypothetical protein